MKLARVGETIFRLKNYVQIRLPRIHRSSVGLCFARNRPGFSEKLRKRSTFAKRSSAPNETAFTKTKGQRDFSVAPDECPSCHNATRIKIFAPPCSDCQEAKLVHRACKQKFKGLLYVFYWGVTSPPKNEDKVQRWPQMHQLEKTPSGASTDVRRQKAAAT